MKNQNNATFTWTPVIGKPHQTTLVQHLPKSVLQKMLETLRKKKVPETIRFATEKFKSAQLYTNSATPLQKRIAEDLLSTAHPQTGRSCLKYVYFMGANITVERLSSDVDWEKVQDIVHMVLEKHYEQVTILQTNTVTKNVA